MYRSYRKLEALALFPVRGEGVPASAFPCNGEEATKGMEVGHDLGGAGQSKN